MGRMKLLLDTNVVIDFLHEREPYYRKTRLLMTAGRVGEFDLWITSSQMTDLIYILSEGGNRSLLPRVLEQLRGLRTFVNVHAVSDREVDRMLAAAWKDPDDSLIFESALEMGADAIVMRNQRDFESSVVKVVDCDEFFAWMREDFGFDYDEIAI
ncbi:type II toxin-antitoxin system VapC family toxin [Gordonibacter massiliensis (ex Traore et al. 2017)]|uniref:PIN domain-containing protein n=1 Tax=Gordonibacter massiliensis (ex Traore et al. 2017) TaxID=1841863 RepID=A0A842JBZ1_9ACTN|nr:PIN domain-containing protein [Gordonibacter massiliensis (ex Traore et al. 2017)]MBC2889393.1 PIN domain-containing protein [Gordonibacter massiliensis (ex Traore et al. 2017)]